MGVYAYSLVSLKHLLVNGPYIPSQTYLKNRFEKLILPALRAGKINFSNYFSSSF
jgi:hypothetical protein